MQPNAGLQSATTFNEKECDQIMWLILEQFLPRSGINRYICHDILYAPVKLQGLGLKDLHISQGLHHVCNIIEHIWKSNITGQFIVSSLEYLQLEIGTNVKIIQANCERYQNILLTQLWIRQTWEFMSMNSIMIDMDITIIPERRENDSAIMIKVLQCKDITEQDKLTFNKCQIYL